MTGRLAASALLAGAVTALIAGCSPATTSVATPRPSSTATPAPPPALRAPADAILPAVGALTLITVRDRLSAAEYAAAQPDEVTTLDQVRGWGWQEASLRQWSGGGHSAEALVLRTDRVDGARLAFAAWSVQATAAPFVGGACPAGLAGLDECREGVAGTRTIVVGRLDVEVFRLDLTGVEPTAAAAAQAQRLRAT
jgi:hypothetical protein